MVIFTVGSCRGNPGLCGASSCIILLKRRQDAKLILSWPSVTVRHLQEFYIMDGRTRPIRKPSLTSYKLLTQLAFYVNLHRTIIGPSATLTGRWWPDIDLRRMLTGKGLQHRGWDSVTPGHAEIQPVMRQLTNLPRRQPKRQKICLKTRERQARQK